ncbi:hypothetical protein FA95DRAFT_655448 [Auriscalpium vulgare]|uniref:Uncharacterized protein n=1 Tax=Auriscalpium vulgare TaxID=40419 RepID=A0ACB8RC34_9AGAM|nr:hypothetical protein FA95DRAFT_655448 [Auriscalpium vulgare]
MASLIVFARVTVVRSPSRSSACAAQRNPHRLRQDTPVAQTRPPGSSAYTLDFSLHDLNPVPRISVVLGAARPDSLAHTCRMRPSFDLARHRLTWACKHSYSTAFAPSSASS